MIQVTDIINSLTPTGRLSWPVDLPLKPKDKADFMYWRARGITGLLQQYRALHPYASYAQFMTEELTIDEPNSSYVLGVVYENGDKNKVELLYADPRVLDQLESTTYGYEGLLKPLTINRTTKDQTSSSKGDLVMGKLVFISDTFAVINLECNFGQIR